jgi:hypothetical protein
VKVETFDGIGVLSQTADVYEVWLRDHDSGNRVALRIKGEAMVQAVADGPSAVMSIIMNEVAGALIALDHRNHRRPNIGQRVKTKHAEGEWMIIGINRAHNTVDLSLGDDQMRHVLWEDCAYR